MNWFSSLFSSASTQSSRRGQALSSTHEAFSIPTSSPIFGSHADAFSSEYPEPDSATSATYTYPPTQGSGQYGYMPTSAGLSSSKRSSLLPTHHDAQHSPMAPRFQYPPLASTWNRIRNFLAREYPELGDTLNYGIMPQDLSEIEMQFGFALPAPVRDSYLAVDGQEAESSAGCSDGLFFGLTLLPLEDVFQEWKFWREVDEDPNTGANTLLRDAMDSIPAGWIRREYSQRGWIPLIADKAGNYIGIDLNPGEKGTIGQVIVFGRDFDTKVVLYNGDGPGAWGKWLASFAEELESGEGFEIGLNSDNDEGSEDELGYESYFYDGTGRGQGDGGGDTGSGGIRLTGEYRGWNPIEAWADRSVRRWFEAGVIGEQFRHQIDEKGKNAELVVDLTEPATEVGIPVVDGDNAPVPTLLHSVERSPPLSPTRKSAPLPTISVTKPPAPLPVELPTPRDIVALPSPPDSTHSSFDEDLESGRSRRSMRDHQAAAVAARKSPKPISLERGDGADDATLRLASFASPTTGRFSPPPLDLLSSGNNANEATSIMEPSILQPTLPDAEEPNDEDPELTTIRLVGGGGESGLVDLKSSEDGEEVNEAEPDNAPSEVVEQVDAKKKHKKTMSGLAGLKKMGNLGRKKDSVSSLKDITHETKS